MKSVLRRGPYGRPHFSPSHTRIKWFFGVKLISPSRRSLACRRGEGQVARHLVESSFKRRIEKKADEIFSLITSPRLHRRFYFGLHSALADVSIFVRLDCAVSVTGNFLSAHKNAPSIPPGNLLARQWHFQGAEVQGCASSRPFILPILFLKSRHTLCWYIV